MPHFYTAPCPSVQFHFSTRGHKPCLGSVQLQHHLYLCFYTRMEQESTNGPVNYSQMGLICNKTAAKSATYKVKIYTFYFCCRFATDFFRLRSCEQALKSKPWLCNVDYYVGLFFFLLEFYLKPALHV